LLVVCDTIQSSIFVYLSIRQLLGGTHNISIFVVDRESHNIVLQCLSLG